MPAPATAVLVAQAVADALNAASLSPSVAAKREYLPVRDVGAMGDSLYVSVVVAGVTIGAQSRAPAHQHDYAIDVGIQKRIRPAADTPEAIAAECDPLMRLAEEVGDLFRGRTLGTTGATCVGVENRPVYHPPHLDELRVFTTVVTLTYRKVR